MTLRKQHQDDRADPIAQACGLIAHRLDEIAEEERRLEQALRVLAGTTPTFAHKTAGFTRAGPVRHDGLNLSPPPLPPGRKRHPYGAGPFARLRMPPLPDLPGLYLWERDGEVVYVGETRTPLRRRLGPQGYARISSYNTFARNHERGGGQQTNCRVNALANRALADGHELVIWYRVTPPGVTKAKEREWMRRFGRPRWNLRHERP